MTKRVLIIGSDPTLLDTRRDVLEANNIPADTQLLRSLASGLVSSRDASLVVACSSLSLEARQTVVNSAHAAEPKLPCLVVVPNYSEESAIAGADATMEALEGPKKFISRIQQLISGTV